MRILASALAITLSAATAPLQCGSKPDPSYRMEDTAGDALWDLAHDFRAKGDEKAARATLRYLLAKYPSSRFAPAAKEQLGGDGADGDAGT